ncbi:MAG: dihydrofolate reductase family protein [Solirubrobacterales bacterium]
MSKVKAQLSMSLDGFIAGPNPSLDEPLGEGGERLHDWLVATRAWRKSHGEEGGETGDDDEVAEELESGSGATVMGRRMFSGGSGPWKDDPNPNGWWGDEPPFRHQVFVLTSHEREPLELGETTFEFVTDGIEPALERARATAGDADVQIAGGAEAAQQYLRAGILEQLEVHVAPILLGGGTRLLDDLGADPPRLEVERMIESPTGVVHLRYGVKR